ncbi:MAG: glutamate--cysteine ligase [Candidatus Omnitrophica bacterium]|nr:glutamate--cysteine ligase [Candidatus Omnitrophota bacterium]
MNPKPPMTAIPQAIGSMLERIRVHPEEIYRWLDSHERSKELPLYSSVDIRDSGFKLAVVDTNLFPAGFGIWRTSESCSRSSARPGLTSKPPLF